MTIFNGRYKWDGTKQNSREPIAWSPGAYDVKIFQRSTASSKVEMLKPYVCIYSKTGEGHSVSANPEKFAKRLCEEFSLEIERVLWVEDHLTEDQRYEVVNFKRSRKVGETYFYTIEKRQPHGWEIDQLEEEMQLLQIL